jgi:hypothetical protein
MAEHQRRAEARWRRAAELGAFLEVGRVVRVQEQDIEVVATLADATETVVAYRAPAGSDVFPSPVEPMGSAIGTHIGDLLVAHLPPADGSMIVVNFGDFDDDDTDDVELPIDRARTQRHERHATHLPPPMVVEGVRIGITGAVAGVMMATIDLQVTSDDPTFAAATLGARGFLPHPHRRAGSGPLWRDWFPPPGSSEPSSGVVRLEYGDARSPQTKEKPTPRPQPRPWLVRALPDHEILGVQGWGAGGGPIPEELSFHSTLRFDPPPDDASGLELLLDELFVFRTCHGQTVTVVAPHSGVTVDLAGNSLTCGAERLDLVRWESSEHGTPSLVVRPSHPGRWPDIRVVADRASVSLWLHPTGEPELCGGLPGMYGALFPPGERVTLALRMLGRLLEIPPMPIQLGEPGTGRAVQ